MNKIIDFSQVKSLDDLSEGDVLKKGRAKELIISVSKICNEVVTKTAGAIPTAYLYIQLKKYDLAGNSLREIDSKEKAYYAGANEIPRKFLKEFNMINKQIKETVSN
jgi:hypothetical protein